MIKFTLAIIRLLAAAGVAISIDFLFFAFTKTCGSCAGFSSYLSSPHSLFAPTWASLVMLVKTTQKH